jgi:hypothetical protein
MLPYLGYHHIKRYDDWLRSDGPRENPTYTGEFCRVDSGCFMDCRGGAISLIKQLIQFGFITPG